MVYAGVFTELIESFGVKGVQVEELIALEPEFFERLNPIYGLVFLFKWVERKPDAPKRQFDMTSPVFFANQVRQSSQQTCCSQNLTPVT